ncbi:hypothetical protein D9M70_638870 [compost metagenome]
MAVLLPIGTAGGHRRAELGLFGGGRLGHATGRVDGQRLGADGIDATHLITLLDGCKLTIDQWQVLCQLC